MDDLQHTGIDTIYNYNSQFLPNWMVEIDKYFLKSVQRLHDVNYYWNNKTISEDGKNQVNYIISSYDLGTPYFD